jgi:hypothetical protein
VDPRFVDAAAAMMMMMMAAAGRSLTQPVNSRQPTNDTAQHTSEKEIGGSVGSAQLIDPQHTSCTCLELPAAASSFWVPSFCFGDREAVRGDAVRWPFAHDPKRRIVATPRESLLERYGGSLTASGRACSLYGEVGGLVGRVARRFCSSGGVDECQR